MDELQAAVLRLKLARLDEDNKKRRIVASRYLSEMHNPCVILPRAPESERHVWHIFVVRTKNREKLQAWLKENGVQTLIHYPIPPHRQKAYSEWRERSYPITESIHKDVISLPMSPLLTNEQINEVVSAVNSYEA